MEDLQHRILDEALHHVVFDGWSQGTLERAAHAVGLTAFDVKRAFPGGVADAVALFSARTDARMLDILRSDHHLAGMKIRERIATAVLVRLRMLSPYREAVRRTLGYYTLPWNMAAGTAALYATVDAIWREAGDTSTDYNFYTKRLMLSKVYSTTLRVWLDDHSDDLAETEAFLRRRIENVMQIEKAKAKLRDSMSTLEGFFSGRGNRRA